MKLEFQKLKFYKQKNAVDMDYFNKKMSHGTPKEGSCNMKLKLLKLEFFKI